MDGFALEKILCKRRWEMEDHWYFDFTHEHWPWWFWAGDDFISNTWRQQVKVKPMNMKKIIQVLLLFTIPILGLVLSIVLKKSCSEEMDLYIRPIEIRSEVSGKRDSAAREGLVIDLKDGRYIDICECVGNLYHSVEPGDSIFKKANSLVFTIARGDTVFEVDITCPK